MAQCVKAELEAIRPTVELKVIRRRAAKRLSGCGLVQLALSYTAAARHRLKDLLEDSGLTAADFAAAIGVSSRSIEQHLAGRKMSRTRRVWYHQLETVYVDDAGVHLVVSSRVACRRRRAVRKGNKKLAG